MCLLALQSITLEYRMDQTVATADNPPVVLGQMPHEFVQSMGVGLRYLDTGASLVTLFCS